MLWREGIVQDAQYLAGVSGGSYAVTAATIVRAHSDDASWSQDKPGPYGLGSPELDYLRNRTNYLAPGLMGRWNMFLRLLLGILLNLAVILGVLFVVGRLGGRIYRWAFDDLGCVKDCTGALKFHGWSGIVIFGLAGVGLAAGLLDLLFRPAADWWWRRLVRWCGTFVFLAIIAAIVLRGIPQLIWWARTSRWGPRRKCNTVRPCRWLGRCGNGLVGAVARPSGVSFGVRWKGQSSEEAGHSATEVPSGSAEVRDRPGGTAVAGDVLPHRDRLRHPAMVKGRDLVVGGRACRGPGDLCIRQSDRMVGTTVLQATIAVGVRSQARNGCGRATSPLGQSPPTKNRCSRIFDPHSGRSC